MTKNSVESNPSKNIQDIKKFIGTGGILNNIVKISFIAMQMTLGKVIMKYTKKKKSEKIIIFTNLYYTGNPRAVYERMLSDPKLRKPYDVYWMAPEISTYLELRKRKVPVLYKHGILSVKIYANTDLWVLAHEGPWNVPYIIRKKFPKMKMIQLGHGVGPKASSPTREIYERYSAWCVSSENIKKRHVKNWNAPEKKLHATGYARLDTLYKYMNIEKEELLKAMKIKDKYRKIILFAPTYDMGIWPWGDQYAGLEKLAKYASERNILVMFRPHPYTVYNKRKVRKIVKRYNSIKFVSMEKFPDTMWLLASTDILMTDWSSIYTDFMLTRRPIIFVEHRKDFFIKERGKSEVPPNMRPGIHVKNEKSMFDAIDAISEERFVIDWNYYETCLRYIHRGVDGKSTERVVALIRELLGKR